MKRLIPLVAALALGASLAACNHGPNSKSAYNNSGNSATTGSTSAPSDTSSMTTTTTTTTPTTSDTSSPNTATTSAAPTDTSSSAGGNVVGDTVTSGKVMAALTSDPGLKDTDINVKSEGGVITLAGTVKSQDQIQIAQNVAQRQEGVTRVDSQITVK